MNIKFSYLYRDGANYKQWNEVIFSNPNRKSIEEVEKVIKANLIDEAWFVSKYWNVPDMHFKEYGWGPSIDHDWHEFDCIEETGLSSQVHLSSTLLRHYSTLVPDLKRR